MKRGKRDSGNVAALVPEMPRRAAVQLMLVGYLAQARQMAEAWEVHPDDERLHQFRIALRRCRMLLRVFNVDVRDHGGDDLRKALTKVADRLGAVRDTDVIIQLIRESRYNRSGRNETEVGRILKMTCDIREMNLAKVRRMGTGREWSKTIVFTERFIRRLMTDKSDPADRTIHAFLDREYAKYQKRMAGMTHVARTDDGVMLHELRVRLRRFRYLGDMLSALADKEQSRIFKRVRSCEKVLGQIHDIDVALEFFVRHMNQTPLLLKRELMESRREKLARFREKWAKYRRKSEK
ncbi:MAG TPA: CHAD domain-containing protein [Kiritimatiellia bacterium]|mgnify:CR=1 FL=1|nr:CHAD domain-containing protein [Kiritimatiellia bacterium]